MKPAPPPACTEDQAREAETLLGQVMRLIWGDAMLDSEGMSDTPKRVIKYWREATTGLYESPEVHLRKTFICDHDEIVIIKDIEYSSLCEHHLLPFHGVAHVGYIPRGRVVGLSKIPRCLNAIAARPQMQERITHDLAHMIHDTLNALGTIVVLEASHGCMSCRGVRKTDSKTVTSAVLGIFRSDATAKAEALALIRSS